MVKSKKFGLILLAVIMLSVLWIFLHRISLVDLVEPLKNNEEITYIRIEKDQGSGEEGSLVEIRDKAVIASLNEQMEKVHLKYVGSSLGISYTSDDYLLIGNCSEATIPRGFSQENPEFSKQKSICEANSAWIFATYLEGIEQIRIDTHRKVENATT